MLGKAQRRKYRDSPLWSSHRQRPAGWTHCSAMMYSPGRGVHGTPATCTWWAISEKSKPRFTPWMVTRVPPSGGPDTVKICRREVRLATKGVIHKNRTRFLSLPKSLVLRNYDETPRIRVFSLFFSACTEYRYLLFYTTFLDHSPIHASTHPSIKNNLSERILNSHKNIPDLCTSLSH